MFKFITKRVRLSKITDSFVLWGPRPGFSLYELICALADETILLSLLPSFLPSFLPYFFCVLAYLTLPCLPYFTLCTYHAILYCTLHHFTGFTALSYLLALPYLSLRYFTRSLTHLPVTCMHDHACLPSRLTTVHPSIHPYIIIHHHTSSYTIINHHTS